MKVLLTWFAYFRSQPSITVPSSEPWGLMKLVVLPGVVAPSSSVNVRGFDGYHSVFSVVCFEGYPYQVVALSPMNADVTSDGEKERNVLLANGWKRFEVPKFVDHGPRGDSVVISLFPRFEDLPVD
jgi:hypothetical protein